MRTNPKLHAAAVLLAALASAPCAQAQTRPAPANPAPMQWLDLRQSSPQTQPQRQLWQDKLKVAQKKWSQDPTNGPLLPAFTLSQTFPEATPPVAVSILHNLYDCDGPGNGNGADLFARCPMRIAIGQSNSSPQHIKTVADVCHIYAPPTAPGQGPDPAKNYAIAKLDASRILHVRVVQYGRPVPQCNLDIKVD
jgi:hypothetical protein